MQPHAVLTVAKQHQSTWCATSSQPGNDETTPGSRPTATGGRVRSQETTPPRRERRRWRCHRSSRHGQGFHPDNPHGVGIGLKMTPQRETMPQDAAATNTIKIAGKGFLPEHPTARTQPRHTTSLQRFTRSAFPHSQLLNRHPQRPKHGGLILQLLHGRHGVPKWHLEAGGELGHPKIERGNGRLRRHRCSGIAVSGGD